MTDMGRRNSWEKACALLATLGAFGCGSQSSSSDTESAVSSDGIIVCGTLPMAYPGATEAPQEWYSVTAMNNKLRHFPEFAAVAPMQSVSNCEQARAFFKSYVEYNELYPNFDRDEPLDGPELPRPADPPFAPAEVTKIKNGTGDKLLPVVGITNSQWGCTGTFIAKNWLMTAAHCLRTASGFVKGTSPEADAKIHSWTSYTVSFAGPGGVVTGDVRTYPRTLQWLDPRHIGFQTADFQTAYDFALLYFHEDYDGSLPNNLPGQTGSNVPYLRVSLSLSLNTGAATMWGMGGPDGSTLQRGNLNAYTVTASTGTADGEVFTAAVPGGTGVPYLCHGDSGGPIVDRYDIDPGNGVPQPQYVAAGTWSGWAPYFGDCADQTNQTVFWVRTEDQRDWIGDTVANYYPLFRCTEKQSANAQGSADYMECWGKPCKVNTDCASTEFCMGAPATLSSCVGCPGGGCDCIYGQCFTVPPP